jgi:nucleoid DNA-binding protein
MRYSEFVEAFAKRLGVSRDTAQFVADEMCEEVLRQLLLGEDVRLPRLGKFSVGVPRIIGRVSNLPGMEGKLSVPSTKKRLEFKSFHSAVDALSRQSFMSMVSGSGVIVTEYSGKARKEAEMAKQKKGEHVTIEVPEGVKQVQLTINVGAGEKKKKRKERGRSKGRLLG